MDKTYNLNELAMMTGFTTRTLRKEIARQEEKPKEAS